MVDHYRNEDVLWYVATRRDTGAHYVLSEVYIEEYEREFERIREYNTIEDAKAAYEKRLDEDAKVKPKRTVKVSKVRGEIRKGESEQEIMDRLREEVRMELLSEANDIPMKKAPARKPAAKPKAD